jgi:hypothetical protein
MSTENNNRNEEIDLGDLFRMIKRIFEEIGNVLLRFLNFLLKNAIVLIVLIVIGAIIGYFWQKGEEEFYKTEMIVATSFGTQEYLFKSIEEAKYKFKEPEIPNEERFGLDIEAKVNLEVKAIVNINRFSGEQKIFLETVNESNFLEEEEKLAMFNRNFSYYKITLYHTIDINGREVLKNLMAQIKDNTYYQEIFKTNLESLNNQIQQNEFVIAQIDTLIKNYSKNIGKAETSSTTIYNSENTLDLGSVLENRTLLQARQENLKREKITNSEFLRIVDFGNMSQLKERSISSYKIILVPFLFVMLYFGIIIFINIVQKARKIQ